MRLNPCITANLKEQSENITGASKIRQVPENNLATATLGCRSHLNVDGENSRIVADSW